MSVARRTHRACELWLVGTLLACGAERSQQPAAQVTVTRPALGTELPYGPAISAAIDTAEPSVVSLDIEARKRIPEELDVPDFFVDFLGREWRTTPSGRWTIRQGNASGLVVRSDGHIVTNFHAVEEVDYIEVRLQDGQRFRGRLVAADPATDLALVKIDAQGLPVAQFAPRKSVQRGQWVVAIGSPFGLDQTATVGIVSAVGRADIGANEIEDYIQTDASMNPGNSGGPLVDLRGRVVGLNTVIAGVGTGIGFAVPGPTVQRVCEQLMEDGVVRRAWIGALLQELTPELAEQFGVRNHGGALVALVVPNGPAAKAGIKPGDIVTEVDDRRLLEGDDSLRQILKNEAGQNVTLGVLRDGERIVTEIRVSVRPQPRLRTLRPDVLVERYEPSARGFEVEVLHPELAREIGYEGESGLIISDVALGSYAGRSGLQPGDLIVEVDREPVSTVQQFDDALRDGRALLRVRRQDGAFFTVLRRNPQGVPAP